MNSDAATTSPKHQIRSRKRRRFARYSLKAFLLLPAIVAVLLLPELVVFQKHLAARKQIELVAIGGNGFEEPFGPNILYGFDWGEVPCNGSFSDTFLASICVTGNTEYYVQVQEGTEIFFSILPSLLHLHKLVLQINELPKGWISGLERCEELRFLSINCSNVSHQELKLIGGLPVKTLSLTHKDWDLTAATQLSEGVSHNSTLTHLYISSTRDVSRFLRLWSESNPKVEVSILELETEEVCHIYDAFKMQPFH